MNELQEKVGELQDYVPGVAAIQSRLGPLMTAPDTDRRTPRALNAASKSICGCNSEHFGHCRHVTVYSIENSEFQVANIGEKSP